MAATGIITILQCLLWIFCISSASSTPEDETLPRIGIIGAGIGGTSTAYFLRQLFGDKAHIDIFESDKVGGRAANFDFAGQQYEAGASIIHIKNRYMLHFNNLYRKDKSYISHGDAGYFGLYGSDGMVLETSEWTAVTLAKLAWRYGLDLYRLQKWVNNEMLPYFEKIYTFQDKGMAFTTCEDLLRAMSDNMFNMTQYSIEQVLLDVGLSRPIIRELAMAAMRTNYGQTTDVHGFVGAVSLLGAEAGLWSVIGGNKNIPEFLLKESQATLIKGRVSSVAFIRGEHSTYELDYIKLDQEVQGQTGTREYDLVILATPLHDVKNKISFMDFPSSVADFSQDFHRTVAMFVKGNINKTTFHLEKESQFPPDLFSVSKDLFFNSIGQQTPVTPQSSSDGNSASNENVWKTFLNDVPTEEQINELFESRSELEFVDWLAYPEYHPKIDLPPFVLHEHLYYVNAIESAASALEMSAIGAKNVALLAFNHWHGHFDRIDEITFPQGTLSGDSKSEL